MKSGLFGLVTLINLNYDKYFEISVTFEKSDDHFAMERKKRVF